MKLDFNTVEEITVPGMNQGTGTMTAKMYMGKDGKVIPCRIHPGGSIGMEACKQYYTVKYVRLPDLCWIYRQPGIPLSY